MSVHHFSRLRRLAQRRLDSLIHAASVGGVSLALLAPPVAHAQEHNSNGESAERHIRRITAPFDAASGAALPKATTVGNTLKTGALPSFLPPRRNPFGLTSVQTENPYLSVTAAATVADLDGDGDLDVLAVGGGDWVYFENTAGAGVTPAFTSAQTNPFGLPEGYYAGYSVPGVADLDGDGDLDVLTLGSFNSDRFAYFENTAGAGVTPTFAAVQTNPFGLANFDGDELSIVDFDSDGDLDILGGGNDGFVYVENIAGVGALPTFAAAQTNPFGLELLQGLHDESDPNPSVADLDGDGDLDVLAGADGNELFDGFYYFENTAGAGSTPSFASPRRNPFKLSDVKGESRPSLADFDGDGDLDMLSGEYYGALVYFENTSEGGTEVAFTIDLNSAVNPFGLTEVDEPSPSIGDLDGDGDFDVLVGEDNGDFVYFENTAGPGVTPTLAAAQINPFGLIELEGRRSAPSTGDFDGDGDLDVLSGDDDGNFVYFENMAGTGGTVPAFASPQTNPFGLSVILDSYGYGSVSTPNAVDLDGDGDLDVLSGSEAGDLIYFENTAGPGTMPAFAPPQTNPFGLEGVRTDLYDPGASPSVADLDGDGDLDILSGDDEGNLVYFENTAGSGMLPAFDAARVNPFGLVSLDDRSAPSMADLDGDGDIDILSGSGFDFFLYFENAGFATAAEPTVVRGQEWALSVPTPNPAVSWSLVRIDAKQEHVRVSVYDLLGREVIVAFDGVVRSEIPVSLDVSELAPGAYAVRAVGETFSASQVLTVVR